MDCVVWTHPNPSAAIPPNLAALFPHQAPCIYLNPLNLHPNLHPVNIDLGTYSVQLYTYICTPPLQMNVVT